MRMVLSYITWAASSLFNSLRALMTSNTWLKKKNNVDEATQDYEGTYSSHNTINNDVSAINSTLSSSPFLIDNSNSSSSSNIGYDHPIKKLADEKENSVDQQQTQKENHENNKNKTKDKKTSQRKGRGKDHFASVAMHKRRNLSRPRNAGTYNK